MCAQSDSRLIEARTAAETRDGALQSASAAATMALERAKALALHIDAQRTTQQRVDELLRETVAHGAASDDAKTTQATLEATLQAHQQRQQRAAQRADALTLEIDRRASEMLAQEARCKAIADRIQVS